MDCTTASVDYADTGYFSPLILDYLKEDPKLRPFYLYSSRNPDFDKIIAARRTFKTDRALLVSELRESYKNLPESEKVQANISRLAEENTFTVCTAHQPNLFTGYLYFAYKILHAVKLAATLCEQYPDCHFVPVYYMGSEDADLEELGTVELYGQPYRWETQQTGAVGRMQTEQLEALIAQISGALGQHGFAQELADLLKQAYVEQADIQTATLWLVHALFGRFGLVTLNADRPALKRAFLPVMEDELLHQTAAPLVEKTIQALSAHYHAQAAPRPINLFYLDTQLRERLEYDQDQWQVLHTDITFTRERLLEELHAHPERFSPNVILRGLYQETLLPNVAFIGGGGELAYWLELSGLFAHYNVPFPLLMLRNSVLWADDTSVRRLEKVGLQVQDLFRDTEDLINAYVKTNTQEELVLKGEYQQVEELFAALEKKAVHIDVTLKASVEAARTRTLRTIGRLEHKLLRAEKNKFSWQTELIREVKRRLFPHNKLQERVDNLLPYYAVYGPDFLDTLLAQLHPLNPAFLIVKEKGDR